MTTRKTKTSPTAAMDQSALVRMVKSAAAGRTVALDARDCDVVLVVLNKHQKAVNKYRKIVTTTKSTRLVCGPVVLHCRSGLVCSAEWDTLFVPYVELEHVSLADTKWERKFDRVYSGALFQGLFDHIQDEPHRETRGYNSFWDLQALGLSKHPALVALAKLADSCTDDLLALVPDEDELELIHQELLLHQKDV